MFFYLFLLFIVLPIVEILILVKIGMLTSIWVPIAIVVVTGVVGTSLARHEGWKVLERHHREMYRNLSEANSTRGSSYVRALRTAPMTAHDYRQRLAVEGMGGYRLSGKLGIGQCVQSHIHWH